jgi:hypothetical protein
LCEKEADDRLLPAFPACSPYAPVEKPYSQLYTFIKADFLVKTVTFRAVFPWQIRDVQGSFSVPNQRTSEFFSMAKK